MYSLVIFDLDGTLLDTIGDLSAAGNHALSQMGLPCHERDEYKRFVGNGIPKLVERMLPEGYTADKFDRALELFGKYYSLHKSDSTKPYPEMPELVNELNERGVICVCNTNKAHGFSQELIRAAYGGGIRDVIGAGIGFPTKPSPLAAQELCRRFATDKRDALYVGDSDVDLQTARNAGIDGCGVLWGFRSRAELEAGSPAYIVENAARLREIILGE